jgi:serine/threonine-protein kinase
MLGAMPSNMPFPGELFAEKYRIERVLGKGAMGVVFAATHVHLHERFALKLLLPTAAADPETVQRFLREGRAAVKIRNEHVARVFDVGELSDRTPYLVMEYLEGSDFAELIDGQAKIACAQAVDYVLQACEAVAEAHSLKIVHRDLKPSNLFLARQPDGSSTVKVLDFGISKMLEPGLAMTHTSAMMGTPLYMSPEQLKSARDVDERADIWSIGVILYQLIAGTPPFVAASLPELCALVLSNQTPWLNSAAPEVDPELARVVATCLCTRVAERYVNLADLADALASFGTSDARASAERIIKLVGLPATRAVPVALPHADEALARTHPAGPSPMPELQTTRGTFTSNGSKPGATPTRHDAPSSRRAVRTGMIALALLGASGGLVYAGRATREPPPARATGAQEETSAVHAAIPTATIASAPTATSATSAATTADGPIAATSAPSTASAPPHVVTTKAAPKTPASASPRTAPAPSAAPVTSAAVTPPAAVATARAPIGAATSAKD